METMIKFVLQKVIIYASIIYIGLCLILFFAQRALIYFPTKGSGFHPDSISTLKVPDASLLISVRQLDSPNALIYFGGNAEEVSESLPMFSSAFPKHSIYLLHYRGYDGSSGYPTENFLHSDAQALFDMVHAKHSNITVVGRSLGSGVAVRLTASNPVSRLVLVTPYDSILNLAKQQFFYFPVRVILKDKFESWRYAPKIKTPTTIIAAENDEVVPRKNTISLYNSFSPGVAKIQFIPKADHNSISACSGYVSALQASQ
jgi:pimeloyl-ACP methyl ester carboxylesterase